MGYEPETIDLNLLRHRWEEIPKGSLFVAYQIHERCNGNGYPRGRSAAEIHDLAKIAAVADTYTALVMPRPHRAVLLPFYAIKIIREDVKMGLYDAGVVRALLETISVYPIGSFVQLNDERFAQVIRANRGEYVRPIVQVCETSDQGPVVIDLVQTSGIEVKCCTAEPELSQF